MPHSARPVALQAAVEQAALRGADLGSQLGAAQEALASARRVHEEEAAALRAKQEQAQGGAGCRCHCRPVHACTAHAKLPGP